MKKRLFIGVLIVLLICFICSSCYADKLDDVVTSMKDANKQDSTIKKDSGIGGSINLIIGLLQVVGTGISVVTITLLGGKYMLSSVEQKAEIKQRAMPVVIGMIILFGAVNMVAIVGNLANTALE